MTQKSLWEILWDYDPNGLVVLDGDMMIRVVNTSFCEMFKIDSSMIGSHAGFLFDDLSDFQNVYQNKVVIKGKEKEYPKYGLYLRSVLFPVPNENLVACIMVDLTSEHQREKEIMAAKQEMIAKVNQVIDRQMQIAQEIASLLGETTAEAKVGLIKIRNMLNEEIR